MAVKIEFSSVNSTSEERFLCWEYKIYKGLWEAGVPGIPAVHYLQKDIRLSTKKASLLVMERLGRSLQSILKQRLQHHRLWDRPIFSMPEVLRIGSQIVSILEHLNNGGLIHGDIKPANILYVASNGSARVFLIDFGCAERFCDPQTLEHYPEEKREMTGTPCFASVKSHCGFTLSRRNDMETLGYVLAYMLSGSLPWQAIRAKDRRKQSRKIYRMKISITPEKFCNDCDSLVSYFKAVKRLKFAERPDYDALRGILDPSKSCA